MTEEDEDDDGGIGSFTSTVCVNFSEDDLRLATIPGQVQVLTIMFYSLSNEKYFNNFKWYNFVFAFLKKMFNKH